ncbi:hypothetical protein D1007_31453 [Hordeum vulgare]|nr:hypothetical protein D1007_31453 [Hordeum vulgare]
MEAHKREVADARDAHGKQVSETKAKMTAREEELEGMAKKVESILEEECHDIFFVAATRTFCHLLLRDPQFKFEEVMGPVPEESSSNLVTAMEGHICMLLEKFSCDDDEEPDEEPLAFP